MLSYVFVASLLAASAAQARPTDTSLLTKRAISLQNQQLVWQGDSRYCLTASSDSNNAAVQLERCSDKSLGSFWTYHDDVISTFSNSKCVDVTNGNAQNGQALQIYDCNQGNTNQQWGTNARNEFFWLGHNFCMDNAGGAAQAGNTVQIWACNGGPNQQWHGGAFRDGSGPTTTTSSTKTSTSTTKTSTKTSTSPTSTPTSGSFNGLNNQQFVWDGEKDLCVTAAGEYNGAAIQLQKCSDNSLGSFWTFQSNGLISTYSNSMCIDNTNGGGDGTKLQLYQCKTDADKPNPYSPIPNQEWVVNNGNLITLDGTQLCMDNTDGLHQAGNDIQVYTCNGGINQQWGSGAFRM
jgi:Ricin-type beta-trefoil lectin domain